MAIVILVPALIVFGGGYLLGAWICHDFISDRYTGIGGCLGGLGALVVALGILYAGCSQMRF